MKNVFSGLSLICFCLVAGAFSAQAWAACTQKCKDTIAAWRFYDVAPVFVKCRIYTVGKGCNSAVYVNGGTAMQNCYEVPGSDSGDVAYKICDGDSCTPACDPQLQDQYMQEATKVAENNCGLSIPLRRYECDTIGP